MNGLLATSLLAGALATVGVVVAATPAAAAGGSCKDLGMASTQYTGTAAGSTNIALTAETMTTAGAACRPTSTVTLTFKTSATGTSYYNTATGDTSDASTFSIPTSSGTVAIDFSDTKAETSTITLSASGDTQYTGSTYTIVTSAGPSSTVAFTTQPGGGVTEGTALSPQPTVTVEDQYGNTVTTDTSTVALSVASYTAGTSGGSTQGTLGCTNNAVAAVAGVATFGGCEITGTAAAGSYTLTATDGSLTSATSSAFAIDANTTASQLAFSTQPVGGVNEGTAFGTQPWVSIEDSYGNVVTGNTTSVTLSIETGGYTAGDGGSTEGSLGCSSNPLAATSGVAKFTSCDITGTAGAGSYVLQASDGSLTTATSNSVDIITGSSNKLVFLTQPVGGVTEGTSFATQPVVEVEDASGNVVTTDSSAVTLSISNNGYTAGNGGSSQGTLTCSSNPAYASSGVATFAGCDITGTAGAGSYTLTASDGSLTATNPSSSVVIDAGTAAKVAFTTQPVGGVTEGAPLKYAPAVSVEDSYGNVVTSNTSSVTLSINSYGAGNGGTTRGTFACATNPVTASSGVASFSTCDVTGTAAAGSYVLNAADGSLASGNSSAFTIIANTATKLAFTTQPVGGVTEGTNLSVQPAVSVEDANGNVVTSDSSSVTLSIGSGGYTAGNGGQTEGTLGCTQLTVSDVSGTATFAGCDITGTAAAGTYTFSAVDGSYTAASSGSVGIVAGISAKLAVTTQPVGGVAEGTNLATQPTVSVEDSNGNVVTTDSSSVTLSISSGPSAGSLSCSGGLSLSASAGVAGFTGCQITGTAAAGTYALHAADGSLTTVNTNSFTVTPGTSNKLVFSTQPVGSVTEGTSLSTQPAVSVEDSSGNVVTTDSTSVTLSLNTYNAGNGGSTEGSLACTTDPQSASAGVATFSGCDITGTAAAGTYTLHAADGSLATVNSASFGINAGTSNKLAFTTQPAAGVTEGTSFPTQPAVSVEDANGNVATTDSSSVTLSIYSYTSGNGGTTQGTLACSSNPQNASSGVATFAGCDITGTAAAGTYALHAADGSLTTGNSGTFAIVAGSASKLAFTTQPVAGVAEGTALGTQPAVSVEDTNGNVVTTNSSSVSLAIESGPAAGMFSCTTNPLAASAGVALFSGCDITGTAAAGSYTLNASDGSLSTQNSSSFSVVAGLATQLVWTNGALATQPNTTVGPLVLQAEDAYSNDANSSISATLHTSSGTGSFTTYSAGACTATAATTVTLSSGTASACYKDSTTGAPSITATDSSGLSTTPAQTVDVVSTSPTQIVITGGPYSGNASTTANIGPFTAQLEDNDGNPAIAGSGGVQVDLSSSTTGTAVFSTVSSGACTSSVITDVTIASGASTAQFCYGDTKGGATPTVTAADNVVGLSSGQVSVTVNIGPAEKYVFTGGPYSGSVSASALVPMTVQVEDAAGNDTTLGSTETLTLSSTSTGTHEFSSYSSGACQSGTVTSLSLPSGTATATFCYGDEKAGSPTVTAATTGLTSATSTVTEAALATSRIGLTGPASGTVSASPNVGPITIQPEDAFGNPTTFPSNTTVDLSSSSAGTVEFAPYSSGACQPTTLTQLVIGAGSSSATVCYSDTKSGSPTLTATDDAGVLTAGSMTFTENPGTATKLAIVTSPFSGPTSSSANVDMFVQAEDSFGNASTVSSSTTVQLSSTSTSGHGVFSNGSGGCLAGSITSFTLSSGTGSHEICYGDELVGSYTLTAHRSAGQALTDGTHTVAITPNVPAKIVLVEGSYSGETSPTPNIGPMTVQLEDAFGNDTTSVSGTTVDLASNSGGTFGFSTYASGACQAATVTQLSIAEGSGSAQACYGDELVGTPTVTASDDAGILTQATATVDVTPSPASQIVFTTPPQSATAGTSAGMGPIGIETEDQFGNVAPVASQTTISLASSSPGSTVFSDDNGGATNSGLVAIPQGSAIASFYYGDSAAGSPSLTASNPGLSPAVQSESISPAAASQLVITGGPYSATVSTSADLGPVTVQAEDPFGNVTDVSGDTDVALSTTSTGTTLFSDTQDGPSNSNVVTIAGGTSSQVFYYGDTLAGTPTITAASGGLASATVTPTMNADAAVDLVFSDGPYSSDTSATPDITMTIQAQDEFGNDTGVLPDTDVDLSTSAANGSFSLAPCSATTVTTATIPSGVGFVQICYGDSVADPSPGDTVTITSSFPTLSTVIPISSGDPSQIVVSTPAPFTGGTPVVGFSTGTPTIGPFTANLEDPYGNTAYAPSGGTTLTFSSTGPAKSFSGATFALYTPGVGCGTALTGTPTLIIPQGSSSVQFCYGEKVTASGSDTVTAVQVASSSPATLASGGISVNVLGATKIVTTPTSLTGKVSQTSNLGSVTVKVETASGALVSLPTGSSLQVGLSSTSPTAYFTAAKGGSAPGVSSITVPATKSSQTYYYGDTTSGVATVTMSTVNLGNPLSTTLKVTEAAGTPVTNSISTLPAVQSADGTGAVTVTVALFDQFDNPVPGQAISLTPVVTTSVPKNNAVVGKSIPTTSAAGTATFSITDNASSWPKVAKAAPPVGTVQPAEYTVKDGKTTLGTTSLITFIDGLPDVTKVSPGDGQVTGLNAAGQANVVTVSGMGFDTADPPLAIDFGSNPSSSVTGCTGTSLTAVNTCQAEVPAADGAGQVDVTVVDSVGTSATTSLDGYIYFPTSGAYAAVTPYRVCDTNPANPSGLTGTNAQCTGRALAAGKGSSVKGVMALQVAGTNPNGTSSGGVPATGVSAVLLEVTAVTPTAVGSLAVWPAGTAMPAATSLSWPASSSKTVTGEVSTVVGEGGMVDIQNNSAGTTNLTVDVLGYFETATGSAGLYDAVTPTAVVGSETIVQAAATGQATPGETVAGVTMPGGSSLQAPVSGSLVSGGTSPVPASGVSAVTLTVRANNVTATGTISAIATGATSGTVNPVVSFAKSSKTAAPDFTNDSITLPVGACTGTESGNYCVTFTNDSTGDVDLVVDVTGYYTDATPEGTGTQFNPRVPFRICDSETGDPSKLAVDECGQAAASSSVKSSLALTAHDSSTCFQMGAASEPTASDCWILNVEGGVEGGSNGSGIPTGEPNESVVLAVTAIAPTKSGLLQIASADLENPAWSTAGTGPATSSMVFKAGSTVTELLTVTPDANGNIEIFNDSAGTVNFTVDLLGWYQ